MSDDIIHDIGSAEDETNEFYHKWLDRKAEAEDLSRKLEEARVRIGELEHELDREKKLHQQANTMRIQQMDRDNTVIESLKAALVRARNELEGKPDLPFGEHCLRCAALLENCDCETATGDATAPETPGATTQATD